MSDNKNNLMNSTKKSKKESVLKLGKVTYGDMPRKDAFEKALAPYFDPEQAEMLRKRDIDY
ncbi:hypothetical protein [Oceanobacillus sojae]|uniref:hypothetical protein n=1 Tax=Oceanobacillus sojae TaxID=582851 RepID=UPI00363872E9